MDEYGIRALIGEVTRGRLSRRQFVETLVGFGLTAPMAAQILTHAGVAQAQPKATGPAPTRRGGGGAIKLLYSAAPTILNTHLAVAPKDLEASQLSMSRWPIPTPRVTRAGPAQETPSVANGGVGRDALGCSGGQRASPGTMAARPSPTTSSSPRQYASDQASATTSAGPIWASSARRRSMITR
jgi:peptide/nickel transport system substrate-binding protein